jgi:thioredoxin 1
MGYVGSYAPEARTRDEVDGLAGATVIEFGTDWCGFCKGAQPAIEAALAAHPDLRHIKVEDGSGRPLGRSFRIKLWPTLVLLRDGEEVARVVRPSTRAEVDRALELLDPPA